MSIEDDVEISAETFEILCQDENKSEKNVHLEIVDDTGVCDLEGVDFDNDAS